MSKTARLAAITTAILTGIAGVAHADPVADFYKGRQINMIIAHEVATGYDIYARALARHIGRHIPGNPTLVPQNMLGASGITGANVLFNVSPKDGSAIGTFAHTVPLDPLIGQGAAKFDPSKFNYLGNMEESVGVCAVTADAGIANLAALKEKETRFGATATTGPPSQMAAAVKNLLGGKVRLVHGYKGAPGVKLAMEKGEVDGTGTTWNTLKINRKAWLDEKKVSILVQYARKRAVDLPDVPAAVELGRSADDRALLDFYMGGAEVGRAFLAPPGLEAQRIAELRTAFDAAMKDPELLAEIQRANAEFSPLTGAELQGIVAATLAVKPEVAAQVKQVLQSGR